MKTKQIILQQKNGRKQYLAQVILTPLTISIFVGMLPSLTGLMVMGAPQKIVNIFWIFCGGLALFTFLTFSIISWILLAKTGEGITFDKLIKPFMPKNFD